MQSVKKIQLAERMKTMEKQEILKVIDEIIEKANEMKKIAKKNWCKFNK